MLPNKGLYSPAHSYGHASLLASLACSACCLTTKNVPRLHDKWRRNTNVCKRQKVIKLCCPDETAISAFIQPNWKSSLV